MIASAATPAAFTGRPRHLFDTLAATTTMSFKRSMSYTINVIRIPLFPLVMFATSYLAYGAAGRDSINGVNSAGFLMIGMIGMLSYSSSVWSSGSAIEEERWEGTIGALFLSPASRLAIIAGHGVGGLLFLLPSAAVVCLAGFLAGARLAIDDAAAVAVSGLMLVVTSIATGFALSAFFVLSRRANLMANVIQHPVYLLGGFIVARDELPGWLYSLSQAVPVAHAVDAFRDCTLAGASLRDIAPAVAAALGTSAIYALLGALGMRKVEHAAKRSGQLDLY
jgi:ABC-2 type transport system permease protein